MEEKFLWTGHPSQVSNFRYFFWCIVFAIASFITIVGPLIFIAMIIYRILDTRYTVYELSNQRFRNMRGVFSKTVDEVELYRVRDYKVVKPFLLRLFGLAHIQITTRDDSSPEITLRAIRNADKVREMIRNSVEQRRMQTKTRDVEFA